MKYNLCINGSSSFQDYELLRDKAWGFINKLQERGIRLEDLTIVSGGQKSFVYPPPDPNGYFVPPKVTGADYYGEKFSREELFKEPLLYKADWNRYGKRAGMVRNTLMAKNINGLLSFWNGQSPGTKHMIEECANFTDLQVVRYDLEQIVNKLDF